MPKIGPYSERDLAEKLTKIPEPEMLAYYKLRMKRYQKWYILAIFIGALSVVAFFLLLATPVTFLQRSTIPLLM